jgi:hypothetical protein
VAESTTPPEPREYPMAALVAATKRCTQCGETKGLAEFARKKSNRDGRQHWCRPCSNEYQRERRARKIAEMGEEAWRAQQNEAVRRHRQKVGTGKSKQQNAAYRLASERLRERHRREFDHLLEVAKREVQADGDADGS